MHQISYLHTRWCILIILCSVTNVKLLYFNYLITLLHAVPLVIVGEIDDVSGQSQI